MTKNVETEARRVVAACLGYRTRRLSRGVTRVYNDCLRPFDMNIAEMNLLAAIAGQGPVQPARLGRAMELEKSTLSRNISRLIDRGWVKTLDHPDGRGVLLVLTARGSRMLLRAIPAWNVAQERARSLVTEALLGLEAGEGFS
jgi:DNA-binding MarR family transcriptional regulator